MLTSGNENFEQESNSKEQPVYLHLSRSVFVGSFTDPNSHYLMYKFP